ncbi:hypothetical protein HDU98_011417 [Podochytrium sp. JEL0797]|nr:hypothetical protein HDU98_011417 [Podochytrium sp. JEL0797]
MLSLLLLGLTAVNAQIDPNGATQPGLPKGCVGSFPNTTLCSLNGWRMEGPDPCAPLTTIPMPGQQVYIQDEQNFCINLPNPNSIFLQNNYYNRSLLPTVVQAEGFVQSFCVGSYLPPGASPMVPFGVRSAHVVKNFTVPGQNYIQIHGQMDCNLLNINCTQSSPGAYDDGGQYDDGAYVSCGKEPYSGTDASKHAGFPHSVEMAGNGEYCMRICQSGAQGTGLPCSLVEDTAGCMKFMGVSFTPGFSYTDASTGVTTTVSVSLPPISVPTTAAAPPGTTGGSSSAVVSQQPGTTKSGALANGLALVGMMAGVLVI